VLRNRTMCLCGMLAAEYQTLPQPMQDAVIRFFDQNESWLESVLEQGWADGSLLASLALTTPGAAPSHPQFKHIHALTVTR
jgi:hypothetical protein